MLEIAEGLCEELGLNHAKDLISSKVETATKNDSSYQRISNIAPRERTKLEKRKKL